MKIIEVITELFDPKLAMPLQWEVSPNTVYAYGQVKTKHGDVSIDITFAKMDEGVWNIEFMVGGSFEVTGGGGTSQVFATVIAGVKKFLTKVQGVHTITFTAEEVSRAKVYDTMAKRVARDLGWHVVPHEDLVKDPKYGLVRSHGSFAFAIEKGHAPEHRQAGQKPQHGKWITVYYVYSRADENLPIVKVKATSSWEAERHVLKTVPEYRGADTMGVFTTKEPMPATIDLGSVPPKPAPRVLNPIEQALKDKLGE